jgi:hypothetical protein
MTRFIITTHDGVPLRITIAGKHWKRQEATRHNATCFPTRRTAEWALAEMFKQTTESKYKVETVHGEEAIRA